MLILAAESFTELLRSGPHWAFEICVELVTGLLLAKPAKVLWVRWHERHDAEAHSDH